MTSPHYHQQLILRHHIEPILSSYRHPLHHSSLNQQHSCSPKKRRSAGRAKSQQERSTSETDSFSRVFFLSCFSSQSNHPVVPRDVKGAPFTKFFNRVKCSTFRLALQGKMFLLRHFLRPPLNFAFPSGGRWPSEARSDEGAFLGRGCGDARSGGGKPPPYPCSLALRSWRRGRRPLRNRWGEMRHAAAPRGRRVVILIAYRYFPAKPPSK